MASNFGSQIIAVAMIAIILTIGLMYIVYTYTGWKQFTMNKGENFQLVNIEPELISKLKFKDCVLTLSGKDGTVKTFNVESVLNTMVYAYKNNSNKNYIFKLDDPGLSAYSFQLPGFSDKNNKLDPIIWDDKVAGTTVTLTGYYKLLN